ncbi:SH3 domain-containing protein C23A1.17-like isoform X1 [Hyalella azteca]|uniref:SH3 domain-containing protein C23A1.17-like isoform X1 n=1 Tax=Hyalella azteca TaxID=294128 RepID=A0A8B7PH57_HYAAZ|nr:SH3 domain-containing protein C23A1.17-like isoform X1 [Hyalella azteca]
MTSSPSAQLPDYWSTPETLSAIHPASLQLTPHSPTHIKPTVYPTSIQASTSMGTTPQFEMTYLTSTVLLVTQTTPYEDILHTARTKSSITSLSGKQTSVSVSAVVSSPLRSVYSSSAVLHSLVLSDFETLNKPTWKLTSLLSKTSAMSSLKSSLLVSEVPKSLNSNAMSRVVVTPYPNTRVATMAILTSASMAVSSINGSISKADVNKANHSTEISTEPHVLISSMQFMSPPTHSFPAPSVAATSVPAPSVPAPSVPAPSVPAPSVPAPSVPAPSVPTHFVPAPSVAATSVPAPSVPTHFVPTLSVSAPSVPSLFVSVSSVPAPSVSVPSVPAPSVSIPSVPAPSVPAPSVPAPSVSVPSAPAPSVSVPSAPAPSVPAPSVSVPSVPASSVSVPSVLAPSVSISSVPTPAVLALSKTATRVHDISSSAQFTGRPRVHVSSDRIMSAPSRSRVNR